jgi:hypothetical protein
MKNAVFWDIKTKSLPHRKHIRIRYKVQPVRFEDFTAVTVKNVVFFDVTPYGFVRTYVSE